MPSHCLDRHPYKRPFFWRQAHSEGATRFAYRVAVASPDAYFHIDNRPLINNLQLRSAIGLPKRGSFGPVDPNSCLEVPASHSRF